MEQGERRMTKEELRKEAEEWLRKYLLCCNCEKKCNCIDSNSYCEEQVLKSYLAGAEPREKRIEELEAQIEKMKNCGNCKNEGNYKEPYRYGTGWCNICKRHKVAKGNFDKWEIKENGRN